MSRLGVTPWSVTISVRERERDSGCACDMFGVTIRARVYARRIPGVYDLAGAPRMSALAEAVGGRLTGYFSGWAGLPTRAKERAEVVVPLPPARLLDCAD